MSQVCGAGRSAEHAVPESVSPYFWTNIMHISSVGIPYAQYGPGVTLRSKDGIRTGRWVGNGTVDDALVHGAGWWCYMSHRWCAWPHT